MPPCLCHSVSESASDSDSVSDSNSPTVLFDRQPIKKRRKKTRSKQKNLRKDTRSDADKAQAQARRISSEETQITSAVSAATKEKRAPERTHSAEPAEPSAPSSDAEKKRDKRQRVLPENEAEIKKTEAKGETEAQRTQKRQRLLGDYIAEAFSGQGKKPRHNSTRGSTEREPQKDTDHMVADRCNPLSSSSSSLSLLVGVCGVAHTVCVSVICSPAAGKDYSQKAFSILPSPTTRFKGSLISPKKGLGLHDIRLELVELNNETQTEAQKAAKAASAAQAAAGLNRTAKGIREEKNRQVCTYSLPRPLCVCARASACVGCAVCGCGCHTIIHCG